MSEASADESCFATVNLFEYADTHRSSFAPPVCNRMIFNKGKLRIMMVGGPNQRKDYHLNLGEEIFFQLKGNMCVKTMECGEPKDVVIQEGECFVLPGKIAHSPQRFEGTIGVVVERARGESELDGLRYYVDDSNKQVLWQRFFHVTDLGSQLVPLIQTYFASSAHQTRVPSDDDVPQSAWEPDATTLLSNPFLMSSRYHEVAEGRPPLRLANREFVMDLVTAESKTPVLPIETEVWLWLIEDGNASLSDSTAPAVTLVPIANNSGRNGEAPPVVEMRNRGDTVLCYEGLLELNVTRPNARVLVIYTTGI